MKTFPTNLLEAEKGLFGPNLAQGFFIRLPLRPFYLLGENIKTTLRLDAVSLPTTKLALLSNQILVFSINPELGYIDGSLYIDGVHHPVDVHKIQFGLIDDDLINVCLFAQIDFSFEGLHDFTKSDWTCVTKLRWTDEAQTA